MTSTPLPRRIHAAAFPRVLALMCLLALVFALTPVRAQEELPPWTIAVAGPMSGDSARLGKAMIDATRLRAEQINAKGGINGRRIEVVVFDDGNTPEGAAEAAGRIVGETQSLLVIGHRTSGASMAASPIYRDGKIVAISGTATADKLTPDNPWYFRVVYNNALQADFIANYINSILKFKTATLISSDSAYGKSLSTAFLESVEGLPLTIAHKFEVEAGDPDIDLTMGEIVAELSLVPDSGVVFLAMNATNAAHFVREMRNSGFVFPVFGPDSINQGFPNFFEPDPVTKTSPGDFTDQIYATTSMIWDVANENATRFRNAFHEKYGQTPDSGMALYYDAASVAFHAIENGQLSGTDLAADRKKIRDYLAKIDGPEAAYSGITGRIYFDAIGNVVKTVPVGVFQLDQFISAPVQLEPVANPVMVPGFADKLEAGAIIPFDEGYMHATQVVYIGMDLNEFSNLNTSTGDYTLDFYMWLRYRGELDLSKLEFSNAVSDVALDNPIWQRERNGMNIVTFKIRGTFHGEFQFRDYPFDSQRVVLELRHRDRTRESLSFVADRLGMRLTEPGSTLLGRLEADNVFRTSLGWRITEAEFYQDLIKTASTLGETVFFEGETNVDFSRMTLELQIARKLTSYSTTILLPMTILFVIGLMLFFVPVDELPPRLSGGILVLVTVSLLRARLSNDLPNIGYLVAMDYIFFALQTAMWFGIMISVASFWFYRKERLKTAGAINWGGAVIYPLPTIGVFVYIWLTLF